jgi:TFIIF-interacting CTD phosphatase-like protein
LSKSKDVYLVAYYTLRPNHSRVNTRIKGWMNLPDSVKYDEQIAVTSKLKTKDLSIAKVILNLKNRTVYKNSWNNGKTFEELFEHFYSGYKKYLDPVINELGWEMVTPEEATNQQISQ